MKRTLRLLSLLVPFAQRPRWREEWLAELEQVRAARGRVASYRVLMGALPDARTMRRIEPASQPGVRRPLHGLGDDLKYTFRSLLKSPGFVIAVAGSLTLGIAGTITTFTFLNAVMFRPFPGVAAQDRLVRIDLAVDCKGHFCEWSLTTPNEYRAMRDGLTSVSGLAATTHGSVAVNIDGRAHSVRAAVVSENYFDVLGVRLGLGRGFSAEDEDSVVIAHTLWLREFGSRPDILGQFISLGRTGAARIAGVAPAHFAGASRADLGFADRPIEIWIPMTAGLRVLPPLQEPEVSGGDTSLRYYRYFGRMKDSVRLAQVRFEAQLLADGIQAARSRSGARAQANVKGVWINDPVQFAAEIAGFLAVPTLVLVVACLNAAGLLLARGTRQARDIAVRVALGASRWRIVRQLIVESVLLSLLSAAASMPIALWALSFATAHVALPMPVDLNVVAFTGGVALLSAVACSLAPALRLSRANPGAALGSSRPGDEPPARVRTRRVLVVCQVALSLALLATGGQLITFLPAQAPSAGTSPDKLLMVSFDVSQVRLTPADAESFYRRLLERVSALPEAEAAGLAHRHAVWTFGRGPSSALAVRRPGDRPEDGVVAIGGYAGGELFRALGLRIKQGRAFSPDDTQGRPRVAIVNQPLADRLFNGAALGRPIHVRSFPAKKGTPLTEVTIVGIIEAAREPSYSAIPPDTAYLPVPLTAEPTLTLYVRARESTEALASRVRETATGIDNRIPPLEIRTLEQISDARQFPDRLAANGVALLGLIGVLLATAGLYGVMSYVVTLRSREIGVRLALGADPASVLRMTLGESLRLAAWGAAVGALLAFVASKIVQSEMHGVRGLDVAYFAGSFLLLAATMVLASALPARRAARVDPITVLRQE